MNTTERSAQELERQAEIVRERGERYGEPADDLGRTAALWSAYLGMPITGSTVCAMMAMVKLSRVRENPDHADSWTDGGAYLAIGSILAEDEKKERDK